jgi:hypothetical protein
MIFFAYCLYLVMANWYKVDLPQGTVWSCFDESFQYWRS